MPVTRPSSRAKTIEAFLGGVARGPCALVLSGEAGIGKTALWEVWVDEARRWREGVAVPGSRGRGLAVAAGMHLSDAPGRPHAIGVNDPTRAGLATRLAAPVEEAVDA